jgi:hypothetical protein
MRATLRIASLALAPRSSFRGARRREPGIYNHHREYEFRTAAIAASGMTKQGSPDEHSDIRGHCLSIPHIAPLIRATLRIASLALAPRSSFRGAMKARARNP